LESPMVRRILEILLALLVGLGLAPIFIWPM
jgi:hypothetical protein